MTETAIRYTTAEPAYDYHYTTHMGVVGFDKRDRPVRQVHIEKNRAEHQCGRYASGNCLAIDHIEFSKQVESGFIRPAKTLEVDAEIILGLRKVLADALAGIVESRNAIFEEDREAREGDKAQDDFMRGANYGRDVTLQAAAQSLEAIGNLLSKAGG